jgi:hypothetical protein
LRHEPHPYLSPSPATLPDVLTVTHVQRRLHQLIDNGIVTSPYGVYPVFAPHEDPHAAHAAVDAWARSEQAAVDVRQMMADCHVTNWAFVFRDALEDS